MAFIAYEVKDNSLSLKSAHSSALTDLSGPSSMLSQSGSRHPSGRTGSSQPLETCCGMSCASTAVTPSVLAQASSLHKRLSHP